MTSSSPSRIEQLRFRNDAVEQWRDPQGRHHDWPVVYLLHNKKNIYVGQSTRARDRLKQHLTDEHKRGLTEIRIVINEEFNTSACLDLESKLIAWLHADTQFKPINRNDGQQNSNYFERGTRYQPIIDDVFRQLHEAGLFTRPAPEIENLNIFKLSPFKALNAEQLVAVDGIVEGLFEDLGDPSDDQSDKRTISVVQGGPGTGKTIVAIYLLKLLRDIQNAGSTTDPEEGGRFSDFFVEGFPERIKGKKIGFIIPQQSLRKTIDRVFKRTPGLDGVKVLSPYTVANSAEHWDILVVDEAHRLTQRGSGPTIGQFMQRNIKLFGENVEGKTAVDWVTEKSNHQIFLIDGDQAVRPADVPFETVQALKSEAQNNGRLYSLESQMRVNAGDGYLHFARALLTLEPVSANVPESYDLRFFDDLSEMQTAVQAKEDETGLARLVAGYAWRWLSQNDLTDDAPYDIELDGTQLRWNRTATDWIASPTSAEEVGSVHTVQGYDLNYAGVIIGPDIVWDESTDSIRPVKSQHFDSEVKRIKDEEQLLEYIRNAYYVLLTRGMLGTYVYVYDEALRARLRNLFLHQSF